MGNIWKKVNLAGRSGYWALFDENTLEPIDLDEDGNVKVYKNPNDTEPVAFGTNPRAVGGIRRERDDKFAAQERARRIDEEVKNSGAWNFANAISYAPYATLLPMAAEIAPAFAPGSAFWTNPITQRMVAGTAMSKGFDAATNLLTGYNSWSEGVSDLVNKTTGWNPNNSWWGLFLTEATNPGWMMNPSRIMTPVGKVGEAVETGVNKAMTLYNSPLTGRWTTIGGQLYRLSPAAGANRISVEKAEPFWDTNAYDLIKTTDKGQHLIREKATGKSYIAEVKFKQLAQERGLNTEAASPQQKYELFLQKEFLPELKKLIEINASDEKIQALFKSYKMADRLSANDIKMLRAHAQYYNNPLRDSYSILKPILDKAVLNTKGAKGVNDKINEILAVYKAKTPEGRLEAIRNRVIDEKTGETIWQRLSRAKEETGIDWRDDAKDNPGTYMTGMDTDLKLKPVGSNTTDSFIERYYNNVVNHILNEGYLLKVLDSGDLFYDKASEMWMGKWPDGKYYRVSRPEEYIKARYAKEVKHADVELPKPEFVDGTWYDRVPMHGAGLGENNIPVSKSQNNWLEYLRKPSSSPGKHGYWTIIRDKLAAKSHATGHYLLENYSVPFYMMPKYETEAFYPGNSYGLMNLMEGTYSGKIMRPIGVQDGVPGIINEYNFGPTFDHNPKSMWNTLDFAPGEGPMAYTPSKITINGENYA